MKLQVDTDGEVSIISSDGIVSEKLIIWEATEFGTEKELTQVDIKRILKFIINNLE